MGNIFAYDFMIKAFAAAVLIAAAAPCIGLPIVLKRFSAIGDAASHSALGGIAFGLLIGINPILCLLYTSLECEIISRLLFVADLVYLRR